VRIRLKVFNAKSTKIGILLITIHLTLSFIIAQVLTIIRVGLRRKPFNRLYSCSQHRPIVGFFCVWSGFSPSPYTPLLGSVCKKFVLRRRSGSWGIGRAVNFHVSIRTWHCTSETYGYYKFQVIITYSGGMMHSPTICTRLNISAVHKQDGDRMSLGTTAQHQSGE